MVEKNKVLNDLHQIISENLHAGEKDFNGGINLKETIESLLETYGNNKTLVNFLRPYEERMKTEREELLVEDFLANFKVYADNFPELSKTYNDIKLKLNEFKDNVRLTQLFEGIQNTTLKADLKEDVLRYAYDKSFENKMNLLSRLSESSTFDAGAGNLYNYVYPILPKSQPDMQMKNTGSLNEGKMAVPEKNGFVNEKKIFKDVDEYIGKRIKNSRENKYQSQGVYERIDNNIKLYDTLKRLNASRFADENLKAVLEKYNSALTRGYKEEMLYPDFLNEMKTNFSYINDVNEEMRLMEERTKDNKPNIELSRLMEIMNGNGEYYYIVPLIEENIVNFEKNPTANNKNILISQLRTFDSCPMVREMLSVIDGNYNSIENYAVDESDRKELLKRNIRIDAIYSPVQYVKENECIFNVDGIYFVKKGNSIAKLSESSFPNLSKRFIALSNLVNSPAVMINEDNTITFMPANGKPILIKETAEGKPFAEIDNNMETAETLKNVNEMMVKYNNFDKNCYSTAAFLTENFNRIGKIDFANRISMNESNKSVILFKLKNNMFIQTDSISEGCIFYRNVKPLQASNIINEEFGVNISCLFDSLMPAKNKIENELSEIKESYENRLKGLMDKRASLMESLQSAADAEDVDALKKAVRNIDHDIAESKKEYLKFQKNVRNLNEGKKSDNDKKEIKEENDDVTDNTATDDNENNTNDGSLDEDGSDDDFEGSDGFDDFSGSDEDDIFGSDGYDGSDENEDEDEFTSSDGDILTEPMEDGSEDDFEVDPFKDEKDSIENEVLPDDEYGSDETPDNVGKDETGLDSDDSADDPFNKDEIPGEEDTDAEAHDEDDTDIAIKQSAEKDANCFYPDFKIVKIDFDENVFTGTIRPTGKVKVIIPWIDADGNVDSKMRSIDFYLKMINGKKGVVFDTEGMSIELYTAIRNYIINSDSFKNFTAEDINMNKGKSSENTENTVADNVEDAPDDEPDTDETPEDHVEDDTTDDASVITPPKDDVFDSGSDEVTTITMHDNIAPHGLDFPKSGDTAEYNDGDTEIEAKAPQKGDVDNIPESKIMDIKATYESGGKKFTSDKLNESKESGNKKADENVSEKELNLFGDINEDFITNRIDAENSEDEDNDDTTSSSDDDEIVDTRKGVDPIALTKDALIAWDENTNPEINDYDVDGEDVSSVEFTLADSPFVAFTYDDTFYIIPKDEFDGLDTKESLASFEDENKDSESIPTADADDPSEVADALKDIIKEKTGQDYDIEEIPDDAERQELENPRNIESEETDDVDENAKVRLKKK